MKRHLLLTGALALAAGVLATTAAAAGSSQGPTVIEAPGPAFPVRTYVLKLPTINQLTTGDVNATEDGVAVLKPSLKPASQASNTTFGVVLVLDKSYSMNGKPIADALGAAQAFNAQRNKNEQLGLVEFNRAISVPLPMTTSDSKISAALSSIPTVDTGTHIYGAVGQAEAMLRQAHIGSGSIILLSDGEEHGNDTKTLSQVAHTALANHIRIYTIGFDDPQYRAGTLTALAAAGHGQYREATAKELAPLFKQLSQQISNQYVLQYTSPSGPDRPVRVKVKVNGVGTARTAYRTPKLTVTTTPPPPYKPSIGSRIESSPVTMVVLALLAAAVVAILVIGLMQPKRSNLPVRMAEFVSIRGLQKDSDKAQPEAEEEATDQGTWMARFEKTLEIADIKMEPEWIIAGTFALTALTFLLIYAGTGSYLWALFALGVPYLVREWIVRTLARRRNRFAEQLPDALQVIASALRSGHSFAGALAVVVESASEPMKSEMQRVVADEQLGIPMDRSLLVVADRMASRDVEQLALVSELQREAGGNAAEVVDRVAETVRERFDLKRLINTLTTQGRMSRWIVSALPIAIILILQVENPHYLHPLLESTAGKVVFGLAAAWAVAGSFVIKRIVEIDV